MAISLDNICPAILTSLGDNMINNPANVKINGGMLSALHDPSNLAAGKIIRESNNDGTGHSKKVRIVYKQRMLEEEVLEEKTCSTNNVPVYSENDLEVTKFKSIPFKMTEEQLRVYCAMYSELVTIAGAGTPEQIVARANELGAASGALSVARELFSDFALASEALIQSINKELLTAALGSVGSWVGGNPTNTYQVQNLDGSIDPSGLFQMTQDYTITGFNGAPLIVGPAGALHQVWLKDSRFFGQAANGINFSAVRDNTGIAQYYYDQNAAGVFEDANAALVFAPGSLLYVPYIQYTGNYGKIGTMWRMSMPMPNMPQVQIDCRILPDECGEFYTVWLEAYFELYGAPLTMFPTGDYLEGVNGVFGASFTKAVAPTP